MTSQNRSRLNHHLVGLYLCIRFPLTFEFANAVRIGFSVKFRDFGS